MCIHTHHTCAPHTHPEAHMHTPHTYGSLHTYVHTYADTRTHTPHAHVYHMAMHTAHITWSTCAHTTHLYTRGLHTRAHTLHPQLDQRPALWSPLWSAPLPHCFCFKPCLGLGCRTSSLQAFPVHGASVSELDPWNLPLLLSARSVPVLGVCGSRCPRRWIGHNSPSGPSG